MRGLVAALPIDDGEIVITAGVLTSEVESPKLPTSDFDALVVEIDYTYSAATKLHVKVYSVDKSATEYQSSFNDRADPSDVENYADTINITTGAANIKRILPPFKIEAQNAIVKISATGADGSDLVTARVYKRYAL